MTDPTSRKNSIRVCSELKCPKQRPKFLQNCSERFPPKWNQCNAFYARCGWTLTLWADVCLSVCLFNSMRFLREEATAWSSRVDSSCRCHLSGQSWVWKFVFPAKNMLCCSPIGTYYSSCDSPNLQNSNGVFSFSVRSSGAKIFGRYLSFSRNWLSLSPPGQTLIFDQF